MAQGCNAITTDWEVCFTDPLASGMNGHDPLLVDRLTGLVDDATTAAGQSEPASIRIAMFNWSADTMADPTYVLAQHIVSAYQAGVGVHLVFDHKATQNPTSSHNPVDLLTASLPAGDVTVCPDNVGCTASDNGSSNYINHNNIVLFDIKGVETAAQSSMNLEGTYKAVWTGSENLVADALNGNDDAMLKVAADDVVDAYEGAFDDLFAVACTTPGVYTAGISPT